MAGEIVSGNLGFSYEFAIDIDLNYNTVNEATPNWFSVPFITDVDPGNSKNFADAATYANQGATSQAITGEDWTLAFMHQIQRDPITGVYITVLQKFLDAASFGKRNKNAKVKLRFYDTGGADWAFQGVGYVSQQRGEKGNKGISGFNFTVTGDGTLVRIPTPVPIAGAVPDIGLVSPAGKGAGKAVTLQGSGFTGATAVTFGGTAASDFTVISSTEIIAVLPAGAAGTVSVNVVTPIGTDATPYQYVRVA